MTIDHKDFNNPARVHESKQILGAITTDAGKVITPSDSSNAVGVLRRLLLSEVDSSVRTPWTGWEHVADATYTSGSPRTITGSTRTQVTIDGAGAATEQTHLPEGITGFWNTGNNQLGPANEGDFYDVRLQFKCSTAATAAFVDCELDVGGALGTIVQETQPILKASSATNRIMFSWPVFTLDTFLINGGTFYITPSDDTDFWDFTITIARVHNGGV